MFDYFRLVIRNDESWSRRIGIVKCSVDRIQRVHAITATTKKILVRYSQSSSWDLTTTSCREVLESGRVQDKCLYSRRTDIPTTELCYVRLIQTLQCLGHIARNEDHNCERLMVQWKFWEEVVADCCYVGLTRCSKQLYQHLLRWRRPANLTQKKIL